MTETPTGGGLDLIREAVLARASVMVTMARDAGVSLDLLHAFGHGRVDNLPAENLDRVVDFIWHGFIEYNAEADALQPREQPVSRSLGVGPTLDLTRLPKYTPGPPPRGPQPVVAPPKPKKPRGWIGGIWE